MSIKNNTGSTITQPIPNGSGWQSDEASIEIEAGKTAGVSIKKEHGIMVVRVEKGKEGKDEETGDDGKRYRIRFFQSVEC